MRHFAFTRDRLESFDVLDEVEKIGVFKDEKVLGENLNELLVNLEIRVLS